MTEKIKEYILKNDVTALSEYINSFSLTDFKNIPNRLIWNWPHRWKLDLSSKAIFLWEQTLAKESSEQIQLYFFYSSKTKYQLEKLIIYAEEQNELGILKNLYIEFFQLLITKNLYYQLIQSYKGNQNSQIRFSCQSYFVTACLAINDISSLVAATQDLRLIDLQSYQTLAFELYCWLQQNQSHPAILLFNRSSQKWLQILLASSKPQLYQIAQDFHHKILEQADPLQKRKFFEIYGYTKLQKESIRVEEAKNISKSRFKVPKWWQSSTHSSLKNLVPNIYMTESEQLMKSLHTSGLMTMIQSTNLTYEQAYDLLICFRFLGFKTALLEIIRAPKILVKSSNFFRYYFMELEILLEIGNYQEVIEKIGIIEKSKDIFTKEMSAFLFIKGQALLSLNETKAAKEIFIFLQHLELPNTQLKKLINACK